MIEDLIAAAALEVARRNKSLSGIDVDVTTLPGVEPITVKALTGGLKGVPLLMPAFPGDGHRLATDGIRIADKNLGYWINGEYALRDVWVALATTHLFLDRPDDLKAAGQSWNKLIHDARMRIFENNALWEGLQSTIVTGLWAKTPAIGILSNAIGLLQGETEVQKAIVAGQTIPLDGHFRDVTLVQAIASVAFPAMFQSGHLMDPTEGEGLGYIEYMVKAAFGSTYGEQQLDIITTVLRAQAIIMMYHGDGNNSTFSGIVAHGSSTNMGAVAQAILAGLGGSNHGAAAELCAQQFAKAMAHCEGNPTNPKLVAFFKDLAESGRPLYGAGHRVVKEDPRTDLQLAQLKRLEDHGLMEMVVPYMTELQSAVEAHTRAQNLVVNVDALTGVLWHSLRLIDMNHPEQRYDTLTAWFGVCRLPGALMAAYWRACKLTDGKAVFGPALMRPRSLATAVLPEDV